MLATHSTKIQLPKRIQKLQEFSYNLWWTWQPEAQYLYRIVDQELWEKVNHNPIEFLQTVERKKLNAVLRDKRFLARYDRLMAEFESYMNEKDTWFARTYPQLAGQTVAYFSTEFGLHESLPLYAGGLGVLSGDHCKEASDLGLPFVAVGFLYQLGYFRQRIGEDGWQEAYNNRLDLETVPVFEAKDKNGNDVLIEIDLPGRAVKTRLWRVEVGRIPLFLMDTGIEENSSVDRQLTAQLYLSDPEMRISQEIVLGIGGVRALRALGIQPAVWHMNEGHSAFLTLERVRELIAGGRSFEQAYQEIKATTVFTTHTPVAAGHDVFPEWMIEKYFANYWESLGMDREQFIQLAFQPDSWAPYSMTVLALHTSEHCNAVSELHNQVSRKMWHFLWPERTEDEVPISWITNGVHVRTWLARRFQRVFEQYLGPKWHDQMDDVETWEAIADIPDETLWAIRKHLKRKLVAFVRERVRARWARGAVHPVQILAGGVLLDPYVLTIGFARRFATYKRAALLLRDPERLRTLITQPGRPVQFIFAGKAHPADEPGKHVIQELYRAIKWADVGGRMAFIEDYDLNIARYLVQGVDVWLNTPRRPMEASGTSGIKAAINGVLNCSVLDGWWREGYNGKNGWAIGYELDEYADEDEQDEIDCESLYHILESEIVPAYYDTDENNIPYAWLRRIKESIRSIGPIFSTRRMLKEYTSEMYVPAASHTAG
ncbi:MAG: alpha-glucan family phosphorylase [Thermoflexales bacterium]|nr:alpha-glucan family phosphorylase [Thermoflexales bacterium]